MSCPNYSQLETDLHTALRAVMRVRYGSYYSKRTEDEHAARLALGKVEYELNRHIKGCDACAADKRMPINTTLGTS